MNKTLIIKLILLNLIFLKKDKKLNLFKNNLLRKDMNLPEKEEKA